MTRRNPLFNIRKKPLLKTAVACLLSRGSGRHGKGKNPVNGYEGLTRETQKAFWVVYLNPCLIAWMPDLPGVWVFHGVAFEALEPPWKAEATNRSFEKCWGLCSGKREPYPTSPIWASIVR